MLDKIYCTNFEKNASEPAHLADCSERDTVTLIGTDGSDNILAEAASEWAGTIHYEFLTRLAPNIPRIVVD